MTDTVQATAIYGEVAVTKMPNPPERVTTFNSVKAGALPLLLLSHAPKRRRACLTVCGLSTDSAWLSDSPADAASMNSGNLMLVQGGQVLWMSGSSEVWVILNTGSITVGVAAEYEENK